MIHNSCTYFMIRNSKMIKCFGAALIVVVVSFVLGMRMYWLRPPSGIHIVMGSLVALFLIFIALGVLVLARNRPAFKAAIAGLSLALLLFGLQLYLVTMGFDSRASDLLFLIICPPIIGAMALDNAGPMGTAVGVLIIALENAVLYALVAATINWLWHRSRSATR
jgi:hypothetical protein